MSAKISIYTEKINCLELIAEECNEGQLIAVSPRSHAFGGRSHVSGTSSGTVSSQESSKAGKENTKRRRLSSAKQGPESSTSGEETLSAPPCLVTFNAGVKITAVAAGGRHTLVLSGNSTSLMRYYWGCHSQLM